MTLSPSNPSRRGWFQFRLRTLLIVVALLSLPLGWFSHKLRQAERQRDAVAKLQAMGFSITYNWGYSLVYSGGYGPSKPENTLARKLLGDDYFDRVRVVESPQDNEEIRRPGGSDAPRLVRCLPDLYNLDLSGREIDDRNLLLLPALPELTSLSLSSTQIHGDGLARLAGMPALDDLSLTDTPLTDAGLTNLPALPGLRWLDLGQTKITGQKLECLNRLSGLNSLSLSGTRIQFANLGKLKLPHLHSLYLKENYSEPSPAADVISPHLFDGVPELEWLFLQSTTLPPGVLDAIARVPKLSYLNLSGSNIADADLSFIAQCRGLHFLGLKNTKVSDAGLHALIALPVLGRIRLDKPHEGGAVTQRGCDELLRVLSKLRIDYD